MSLSLHSQQNKIVSFDFTSEKIHLLKNTVCKNSTNDELELFMHVCQRTGLDPFRNQIYAIKRKEKMTIQTGIDGFRLIAERTGKYTPGREATYTYDEQGRLKSATSYIKKQTHDGSWHEVSATAFWSEYVQEYNGKPSQFWAKMPHTMLSKVAESICLRKAFPADLSGIYTSEEMAQAEVSEHLQTPNATNKKVEYEVMPEEKDLTNEEVEAYIQDTWNEEPENFRLFMDEMMKVKNWNYRKCIETFKKYKEHTSQTFMGWLANKVGI